MTSMLGRGPMGGSRGPAGNMQQGNSAGKDIIPKGYRKGQLQQFTPEQMELFQQMFSQVDPESFLSKLAGGSQQGFEQMEAPAIRQFQELSGQNASRFSGMGMGARGGSGFQNVQNQATSDFAMNLQANRMNLQRQAIQDLMGLSSNLLGQRPQENFLVQKPQKQGGALGGWGGALGAVGGGALGFLGGGPAGAYAGANIGSSAFGGM